MRKIIFLVFASLLLVACDGAGNESSNNSSSSNDAKSKPDKWWERTDKYAICYGKITAAHKANGLHQRNRSKSIQIKEELCKIAATSETGEGSHWLK